MKNKIYCLICKQIYNNWVKLMQKRKNLYVLPFLHQSSQRNIAQDSSMFYCNECEKQFCGKSSLNLHKKSVHEGFKYPCKLCNYKATLKSSLQKHINSIHEGVKYPCDQCSYKATTKSNLQRHINSAHFGWLMKIKFNSSQ